MGCGPKPYVGRSIPHFTSQFGVLLVVELVVPLQTPVNGAPTLTPLQQPIVAARHSCIVMHGWLLSCTRVVAV